MEEIEKKSLYKVEKMDLLQSQEFVKNNFFEIKDRILSSCIDGRYNDIEARRAPRSLAGSDAGWLIILAGTLNELKTKKGFNYDKDLILKIFNEVVNLLGGINNFMIHTDSHNREKLIGGCGHMCLAKENYQNYGLSQEEVNLIFDFLNYLKINGAQEIVLEGDHKERAVFIINSKNIGLLHQDNNNQVFVFHKSLYEEFLNQIALYLKELKEFHSISEQELKDLLLQVGQKQLEQTLSKLAANLPIYNIQEKNSQILV